jgi:hypothetical protein
LGQRRYAQDKVAQGLRKVFRRENSAKLRRILGIRTNWGKGMAQNFENHTKIVPAFHYFVLPVLAINLGRSIYRVAHQFSGDAVISVLLAAALILLALYARMFALTVQDRVIRLEMQLRLRHLLPPDQHPCIVDFTVGQLVALRFASDAELPGLARKVLDEKVNDRKTIKKMIQNWQTDLLRA